MSHVDALQQENTENRFLKDLAKFSKPFEQTAKIQYFSMGPSEDEQYLDIVKGQGIIKELLEQEPKWGYVVRKAYTTANLAYKMDIDLDAYLNGTADEKEFAGRHDSEVKAFSFLIKAANGFLQTDVNQVIEYYSEKEQNGIFLGFSRPFLSTLMLRQDEIDDFINYGKDTSENAQPLHQLTAFIRTHARDLQMLSEQADAMGETIKSGTLEARFLAQRQKDKD